MVRLLCCFVVDKDSVVGATALGKKLAMLAFVVRERVCFSSSSAFRTTILLWKKRALDFISDMNAISES